MAVLDVLNVAATLVIAGAAAAIAFNANRISHNANVLSADSMQLEADKQLLDWARRVLAVYSSLVNLRQRKDTRIDADEFDEKRRELRAELFALRDEGALYFPIEDGYNKIPALAAMNKTIDMLSGIFFHPPAAGDYQTVREPQVKQIQAYGSDFLEDVKTRIDSHWIEQEVVR